MQGIVGRAWASFRKFITSLTLIVEPPMSMSRSSGNWHTHAHLEDWRDATWRNSISIPCTCTRHIDPWQKHAWTLVLALRPSCQTQGMLRASRNPIWLDVMYFAEDNRALLLHCASLCVMMCARKCTHQCGPCDNVHVQASWVFSWSWSRSSPRLKRNPILPDVMYFLLSGDNRALHWYARNRRGSVALYCASVCALCAARCGACDRWGLARKKVQGWRKGAGSKIAVGPPIPIYMYIFISRVTESQANTSVWGSLKLAPTNQTKCSAELIQLSVHICRIEKRKEFD